MKKLLPWTVVWAALLAAIPIASQFTPDEVADKLSTWRTVAIVIFGTLLIISLIRMAVAYFRPPAADAISQSAASDDPLDEMIAKLAEQRRTGQHPKVAAISSGPLAIAPSFRIEDMTGALNDADAAVLAQTLIDEGDPFSLIAAFELLCRHIDDAPCREIADSLIETLWGEPGTAAALAEDFCTAAIVAMTVARWQGQVRDWPVHGQRLVTLAHAGHICRIFRQFEIKRPELYDRTKRWFAPQMRQLDRLDRRTSRGWTANFLVPEAVEAYLLSRFDQVLDTLPEEDRPEEWLDTLRAEVHRFGGANAYLLRFPGPLDEFSSAGRRKSMMTDEDVAHLTERMCSEPPSNRNAELLFSVAMSFVPPASDLTSLTDAILTHAKAAAPELREAYHHTIFQLAGNWALPDLAEGAAGILPHSEMNPASLVDEALAIAAAHPEEAMQLTALATHLLVHAQTIETGPKAAALCRAIDSLINAEPKLAALLHQTRMTAALAI